MRMVKTTEERAGREQVLVPAILMQGIRFTAFLTLQSCLNGKLNAEWFPPEGRNQPEELELELPLNPELLRAASDIAGMPSDKGASFWRDS